MKVSDLITHLQRLQREHGDLNVVGRDSQDYYYPLQGARVITGADMYYRHRDYLGVDNETKVIDIA